MRARFIELEKTPMERSLYLDIISWLAKSKTEKLAIY
jgi:hypothetical protein